MRIAFQEIRAAVVAVLALVASLATDAVAEVTSKPSAQEIVYFGRWSTGSDERVSQWAGAYLKVGFTGDRITAKLGDQPSSFYAIIDGKEPQHVEAKTGDVELTIPASRESTPADGTHQLKLIAEVGKELRVRGFELPEGQSLKQAQLHPGHVLFIGDSITYGASATNLTLGAWAPASAAAAGLEHDRIAQGGVGLVSGYDAPAGKVGMEERFFKLGALGKPEGGQVYPVEQDRQPSIIVINLGTNDGNKNEKNPVPADVFQERYAAFIRRLRQRYPEAKILALQLFNTYASEKNKAIEAAVQVVKAAGDRHVHYVSTNGWVDPNPKGGDIKPDWSHPTDQGHQKLAAKMTEVLKQHSSAAGAAAPPKPAPTAASDAVSRDQR